MHDALRPASVETRTNCTISCTVSARRFKSQRLRHRTGVLVRPYNNAAPAKPVTCLDCCSMLLRQISTTRSLRKMQLVKTCQNTRSVGDGGVRRELPLRLISFIGKVEVRVGISLCPTKCSAKLLTILLAVVQRHVAP